MEPTWTVCLNGLEFQTLHASDISIEDNDIRAGKWNRRIHSVEWLRPNMVRIHGRQKMRTKADQLVFYPGDRLPSGPDLRRRRRAFQIRLGRALAEHFKTRSIERQILYSDRGHGIGGAYPRFIAGNRAVIAADPDDSSSIVNAVIRAALLWAPLVRKRLAVVLPKGRANMVRSRLEVLCALRQQFDWLEWDGERLVPLALTADEEVRTEVREFRSPAAATGVAEVLSSVPFPLQPVLSIATNSVSIRFKGLVQVRERSRRSYQFIPQANPLPNIVKELDAVRRHGSRHPLARAYEERWLESNIVGQMATLLPSINSEHVYPQVPSFVREERNIIDLLTVYLVRQAGGHVEIKKRLLTPICRFRRWTIGLPSSDIENVGTFSARGTSTALF